MLNEFYDFLRKRKNIFMSYVLDVTKNKKSLKQYSVQCVA